MQRAQAILTHAIRMLTYDSGTTFRVILPALLMVLGSTVAALVLLPDTVEAIVLGTPDAVLALTTSGVLGLLLVGLIGIVGYTLMAVLWHRHVLLSGADREAALRPGAGIVLRYMGRAVIVALWQFLAGIPIVLVMGLVAATLGAAGNPTGAGALLVGFLGGIAFVWIALRISLCLPAAAVGERMSVAHSWKVTAPVNTAVLGAAALLSLLNFVLSLVVGLLLPGDGLVPALLQTCVFLVEGIIFVSVLTTLYGHLVEGRPLN